MTNKALDALHKAVARGVADYGAVVEIPVEVNKCSYCGYVRDSYLDNPVTAMLGPQPCKDREWSGHSYDRIGAPNGGSR